MVNTACVFIQFHVGFHIYGSTVFIPFILDVCFKEAGGKKKEEMFWQNHKKTTLHFLY